MHPLLVFLSFENAHMCSGLHRALFTLLTQLLLDVGSHCLTIISRFNSPVTLSVKTASIVRYVAFIAYYNVFIMLYNYTHNHT